MKPGRCILLILILVFCLFGQTAQAEGQEKYDWGLNPSELIIEQVYSNLPDFWVYFRLSDRQGRLLGSIDPGQLSLRADGQVVEDIKLLEKAPDARLDEALAITLILDISMSLRKEGFKNLQLFASGLLSQLQPDDRVMIILAGDQVQVLSEFSPDFPALIELVNGLNARASNTLLYDAVQAALRQNTKRAPDMPRRRLIVLISDGHDEGSGITLEELEKELNMPVYAVGYNLGSREYVTNMRRLAAVSAGHYFHLRILNQAESMSQTLMVLLNNLLCLKGYALEPSWLDSITEIELQYRGETDFRAAKKLTWLSDLPREELDKKKLESLPLPPIPWYADWKIVAAFAVGILLLLVIAVVWMRRRTERKLFRQIEEEQDIKIIDLYQKKYPKGRYAATVEQLRVRLDLAETEDPKVEESIVVDLGIAQIPSKPVLAVLLFVELEGESKGEMVRLVIKEDSIVIGRDSSAFWQIDEGMVSGHHARLNREVLQGKAVYFLEDLGSTNGTLVNGVPIETAKRIERNDVIWIGKKKYRFMGEET